MPQGLTAKQQHFATLLGLGNTKAHAYRQAYDVEPNNTDPYLYVMATQLSHNHKVSIMADAIREQQQADIIEIEGYSRGEAFKQSQEDRALAHDEKQAGAAVSATKLSAQLAGHLDDKSSADKALEGLATLMQAIAGGTPIEGEAHEIEDTIQLEQSDTD